MIIGESIFIMNRYVSRAVERREKAHIQELALRQAEAGADYIDLNIGPQRRTGPEVMTWMVETIQEVTDVPLSLDTANVAAIEAGLKVCKKTPIINSTDASDARLNAMMPMAGQYNAKIIALTFAGGGLPTDAAGRISLAMDKIMPAAAEYGVPIENIIFDPLVLTINGMQEQILPTIEAIRFFKVLGDPAPWVTCGLSNVSNTCPDEVRSILERVFYAMATGAGLNIPIANALDPVIMEVVGIIDGRDDSTAKGALYLAIHDAYAADEPVDRSPFDASDPELQDILKTLDVMENKWIYAHSYLKL